MRSAELHLYLLILVQVMQIPPNLSLVTVPEYE